MNKIRVLSDNLANQIAAGEVVERPASVIKELLENAIDAGATRLRVDVELGGRRLMRISDNGEGMSRDDAVLAFERHATSKIRSQEDLAQIGTLGFRGEALASIASVARVELVTKSAIDLAATRIVIEGGRLIDVNDAARDQGTTISVRDLFFNTPARRKFMRSEATENFHLTSIVTHYALALPEIAFELFNNGRQVMAMASAKDLRERAFQIFGGGLLDSLLTVDGGREHVARVYGFISAPRERRTTRDSQYFFVNKRFVRDKTIAGGLIEGFRSVLPHGVYPVAFLFIELPLDEVDVNVHPAKTEVRFRRGEAVRDVIADAVRNALSQAGITTVEPPIEAAVEYRAAAAAPDRSEIPVQVSTYGADAGRAIEVQQPVLRSELVEVQPLPIQPNVVVNPPPQSPESTESNGFSVTDGISVPEHRLPVSSAIVQLPPVDSAARFAKPAEVADLSHVKISPLGQLHESFIIAVDDEGLLLIDQHVAHERILFDKFRRGELDRGIESQNLLLPETIDLSPAQAEAFTLIEGDLLSLGFQTMRLSGRTIAIKGVPTDVQTADARNLFAELLDLVDSEKRNSPKSSMRDHIAASMACKAAVKINMKLTDEKMRWMIDRLLVTTSPTTCPHGRPVILRLSMKDIERAFHRS